MNFHELSNIIRFKKIQKFKIFPVHKKLIRFYEFGMVEIFRVLEFLSVWQMAMRFESVSSQSIRKGITVNGEHCTLEYQLENSYITLPHSLFT